MAKKNVNSLLLFCVFLCLGNALRVNSQSSIRLKDTCYVLFEKSQVYNIDRYTLGFSPHKINFHFINDKSLKSPLFVFDSKKDKSTVVDSDEVDKIEFSDPWEVYDYFYRAKDKPKIFLISHEGGLFKSYPVTIEFPPPPPLPKPLE